MSHNMAWLIINKSMVGRCDKIAVSRGGGGCALVISCATGGTRRGGDVMGGGQSTYQAGILETWDQIIEGRSQMSPATEPTNTYLLLVVLDNLSSSSPAAASGATQLYFDTFLCSILLSKRRNDDRSVVSLN